MMQAGRIVGQIFTGHAERVARVCKESGVGCTYTPEPLVLDQSKSPQKPDLLFPASLII